MRLSLASLALGSCVATATAQYLSEGWKPGQAVTSPTHETATAQFTPAAQPTAGNTGADAASTPSGLGSLFTEGPIGSLLAKVGFNLSAAAQAAAYQDLWDSRIPLIHDDNYEELIVNEPLTPEEEENRLWFLIMYAAPFLLS